MREDSIISRAVPAAYVLQQVAGESVELAEVMQFLGTLEQRTAQRSSVQESCVKDSHRSTGRTLIKEL